MSELDVIVIGAGAAGLAAARACSAQGRSVTVLEARSRPGGRAHTVDADGWPVDLGCGWLHSADCNPLVQIARDLGFQVDERAPPWRDSNRALGFAPGEHEAFREAQSAFYDRLDVAAEAPDDSEAARWLAPDGAWNPLINAVSTYVNGTELDRLSTKDFVNYHDTEINFRIVEGYGALFAKLAEGQPIVFDCAVSVIDHSGSQLRVVTERGEMQARAVIVTAPTNIIASGALRFLPGLADKVEACAALPLGVANKIFLAAQGAEDLPDNARLFGARNRTDIGAYHFRPFGRPMIEGYFGGQFAREVEKDGLPGFADVAINEVAAALGSSWKKRLRPLCASFWASDPHALGSYSHALPGEWARRAQLAEPVENRIFFAGEATSLHNFSTAHGAWQSGERAAAQALRALMD
ncbi:MAG: NAD(P)/FAD-dependent oxidoreductase [Beijerinckiaceae bacterium]|nr:NAD(P)/FAD-dependent oxidoreductase [Beijerinckiaceae bacterium]